MIDIDRVHRMRNFRSPKLLRAAQDRACQLQIPGVCWRSPVTTVAAHSNLSIHGRGSSFKAHDWACSWACYGCHQWLDEGPAPREEKELAFYRGLSRTLAILFNEGVVVVA